MGLELGLLHYGLFVPNPGGECCIKYIIPDLGLGPFRGCLYSRAAEKGNSRKPISRILNK
jgi:hypothetical protein